MSKDNPTVSEALDDANAARTIRQKHVENRLLQALTDKIGSYIKQEKRGKEEFVDALKKDKTIEHEHNRTLLDSIKNFASAFSFGKSKQPMSTEIRKIELSSRDKLNLEDTQKRLLDEIIKVHRGIDESNKLENKLVRIEDHMDKMIEEQTEHLKTVTLRNENYMPSPYDWGSEEKQTMIEKIADSVGFAIGTLIGTSIGGAVAVGGGLFDSLPKALKGITRSGIRTFGWAFELLSFLIKIINPFKKILLFGSLALVLGGMFNLTASFQNMGEWITKFGDKFSNTIKAVKGLFSLDGGISGIFENLKNVFSSFTSDFANSGNIFSELFNSIGADFATINIFSDKFKELMGTFVNLFHNQLMPSMVYLVDEVFKPLGKEIAHLSKLFWAWWNESGTDSLKSLSDFMYDTLIFFFGTVLPPVLDALGFVFDKAVDIVKSLYGGLKKFIVDFTNFISTLSDVWAGFDWNKEGGTVDLIAAIGKTLAALVNLMLANVDNLATMIIDALDVRDFFGMDDQETVMGYVERLRNTMIGKIESFIDNGITRFNQELDDAIAWVAGLNPIPYIKAKIADLLNGLINIIPGFDDIKEAMSGFINSATPDWLKNLWKDDSSKVKENPMARLNPNYDARKEIMNETKALEDALIERNRSASAPIVIAPSSSNTIVGGSGGGGSVPHGTARTAPQPTPLDRTLNGR